MDSQSRAFREAPPGYLVTDEQIELMIEHGELLAPNPDDPILLPEGWNTIGWDEGRQDPKSVEEAQAALRNRATTTNEDPTAYDDLGD